MNSYGEARDPEWIQEAINSYEKIAACVTELLNNNLSMGSLPQGRHEPMVEVASTSLVTALVLAFGYGNIEMIRDEIWPNYTARTYTLYDLALTESKEKHNEREA